MAGMATTAAAQPPASQPMLVSLPGLTAPATAQLAATNALSALHFLDVVLQHAPPQDLAHLADHIQRAAATVAAAPRVPRGSPVEPPAPAMRPFEPQSSDSSRDAPGLSPRKDSIRLADCLPWPTVTPPRSIAPLQIRPRPPKF